MTGPLDVAAALAAAAQEINRPQDLDAILNRIVGVARDSMTQIDHVGITLVHRDGRVETRARTDSAVDELDALQYALHEGPCLHAIHTGDTVRVEHARHEQRWPAFMRRAADLGLRSMLGVRLNVGTHTVGALNMYSFSADEMDAETEQLAELFAAHVALALGHAERLENLNVALSSRKTIGLALGILMEKLDIDEDTAFAYLTRMSASNETQLRDVAASVVDEARARRAGELPSEEAAPRDQTG
jgi:GAF domain-containing protein